MRIALQYLVDGNATKEAPMLKVAGCLMVLVVAVSLAIPVMPAQASARTWTVLAGPWPKPEAVVTQTFLPGAIEVAVGDTVKWKFEGFHTVTFLGGQKPPELTIQEGEKTYFNPQIFFPAGGKTYDGTGYRNSGTPPEDPREYTSGKFTYTLTFTKAGTYPYLCMIHGPAMSGTVVVKNAVTTTSSSLDRAARNQQAAILRAGQAAWARSNISRQGTNVTVALTGDPQGKFSILRFTRRPLVIKPGTTVTWKNADPFEIHTVTFTGGQKVPEFVVVEPQKQGPPKLLVNSKAAAPTAAKTYDGMGYANSGILFPAGAPGNVPHAYSLTFTKPGTYQYLCLVHILEGMKGTIIVK